MKFILFILVCLPIFIFSYSTFQDDFGDPTVITDYPKDFAQCLMNTDSTQGFEILQRWQAECPEDSSYITGCYSVLHLLEGDITLSINLMKKAQKELYVDGYPLYLLEVINCLYSSLESTDEFVYSTFSCAAPIHLCKKKQPKGVKFKFWVGVAQITGGCLLMPFVPVAGAALIGAGGACVIDATASSLNNQEEWERELNERQRIDYDNLPPPYITFFRRTTYRGERFQLYAC